MELSGKEKDVLLKALEKLEEFYDNQEKICREFKWICNKHLPQVGEGYIKNINVFEIQDKTIEDIKQSRKEARETINKIIDKC